MVAGIHRPREKFELRKGCCVHAPCIKIWSLQSRAVHNQPVKPDVTALAGGTGLELLTREVS